jgi:predicted small lipoprotein YifL
MRLSSQDDRRMGRTARVRIAIAVTTLSFTLAACGGQGDLVFDNASEADVSVLRGEDEFTVEGGTTTVVLGAGCTEGEVEFTFTSGATVTVEGPVCPDQEFVIADDDVQVRDRQDG